MGVGTLDRVVAVLGRGQGTGVLVGSRVVLTARHVVADSDVVEVIHPSGTRPVRCRVTWWDEALDAVLLRADHDVISAGPAARPGRMRFGRVATDHPLPHCQIVGFPQIQRYGDEGHLEYDQYRVSVLPMAGRMRNVLVCELDVPAADERDRRASPLQGLSGAPVFAGAVLLGVVTEVPRGRLHSRVEAASVEGCLIDYDVLEEVTDLHPKDDLFEARYAKDLSSQYRRTEIFGIEELGGSETRWDLDTAYLSLEAEAAPHTDREYGGPVSALTDGGGPSAQRVDTLLSERPRALLRGQAGAGKTTLIWWLAAHAANGTLDGDLAELNGLVPFVVPMREVYARGGRFPAVSELLSAGGSLTDDAPEGWTRRVLEARRGLLLVDGLDEVPAQERERARRWLSELLDRYRGTRCLATVRPDAVDKNWLASDGFAELTLLPMSDEDIQAFVTAWHDAARLECVHVYGARRGRDEQQLLASLEQELIHQLGQNAALRDLARTPLLCAVICALHRRRRGLLPTSRWALYRAALTMLLGGRDAERGVTGTDGITLDSDEQHALVQRLAIWLVRTGQQQMTHEQAIRQLDLALRDMPQIRGQATADRVLRFLLDRSGLLQERADDAIQFIHRTFQDFLAAKEFHESGYILELLEHAGNEAWRDVLVLAVGHATRTDAHHLIEKLVESGDTVEARERKWYFHLLAAQCATGLRSVNAGLMDVVRERVRALMPPRAAVEAHGVAELGAWAVDLLPEPEELGDPEPLGVVRALTRIRAPEARRKLKRFAAAYAGQVSEEIVNGWQFQPAEEYAREVLAHARIKNLFVQNSSQLAQLSHVGSATAIVMVGSYRAEELGAHLSNRGVEALGFVQNKVLTHLSFLRERRDLRHVSVTQCPALRDLSALPDFGLRTLQLDVNGIPDTELRHLGSLHGLRTLQLVGVPAGGWTELPALPAVRVLEMTSGSDGGFGDLDRWTSLEELRLEGPDVPKSLRAMSSLPRLTHLALRTESLRHLTTAAPLHTVRDVHLYGLRDCADVTQVRRVFPNLGTLTLALATDATGPLDLTGLQDLPDVQVCVTGLAKGEFRVLGTGALGSRFTNQLSHLVPEGEAARRSQRSASTP